MRGFVFAFVFFVTAIAGAAESSAADRESARAYMAEGRQKRDANDFKSALRAFEAADAIMHVPTTAFEVAKTQSMMGLLVEARDEALRIARTSVTPGEPPPFAEARAAAQKLADDLESRVPSIRVTLKGGPDSGVVTIDGVVLPAVAVGLPRKLDPGTHVVVAKAAAVERSVSVQLLEREAKEIPFDLTEIAPPVVVSTTLTAPLTQATPSDAHSSARPWLTLGIVGLAIGGAGIAVGAVTGLMSINDTNAIKSQCSGGVCPATLNNGVATSSALSDARTLAMASDIAFIAGGVIAAVGVTFVIVGATKSRAHASEVSGARVKFGAGPGSVFVTGSF